MQLVAVPSRVFKQFSTIILLFTGLGDLVHVLLAVFAEVHLLTSTQLTVANGVLAFLAGASKLVQQNIALTDVQKDAMIAAVEAAPTKAPKQPMGDAGETEPMGPP